MDDICTCVTLVSSSNGSVGLILLVVVKNLLHSEERRIVFAGATRQQSKLSSQCKPSLVINSHKRVDIVNISRLGFLEHLGQQSFTNTFSLVSAESSNESPH